MKSAANTVSIISTLIESNFFLKLLAAKIIARRQHTIEMILMTVRFCIKPGNFSRYALTFSFALREFSPSPVDDHIIKKIRAGSNKSTAIAAFTLDEVCDVVVI